MTKAIDGACSPAGASRNPIAQPLFFNRVERLFGRHFLGGHALPQVALLGHSRHDCRAAVAAGDGGFRASQVQTALVVRGIVALETTPRQQRSNLIVECLASCEFRGHRRSSARHGRDAEAARRTISSVDSAGRIMRIAAKSPMSTAGIGGIARHGERCRLRNVHHTRSHAQLPDAGGVRIAVRWPPQASYARAMPRES